MNYQNIRETVVSAILEANDKGLIHGTSGNISMRDEGGSVIAITPTSVPYDNLKAEDITIIDLQGSYIEGLYKPSSETPMHTSILRARPDVNAVVHTHSLYATVMSMRDEPLDIATIPSCLYYPIRVATPFALPGSDELADAVVKALGETQNVVLLRNHGLVAIGSAMDGALTAAVYAEEAAQVGYYALLANFTEYISEENALKLQSISRGGRAV